MQTWHGADPVFSKLTWGAGAEHKPGHDDYASGTGT